MWPVIVRELRAEARRPANYWLRLGGAGVAMAAFLLTLSSLSLGHADGPKVFTQLNVTLFVSIWIIVPLMTADCLSREKREGTLGLLFLTPLTARGVVIGKTIAQALRAVTILLAMLPVLAIPAVMGGVSWTQGLLAATFNTSALALALGAGLLASSFAQEWGRAAVLALIFSLLLYIGFACYLLTAFYLQMGGIWPPPRIFEAPFGSFQLATGARGDWTILLSGRVPSNLSHAFFLTAGETPLFSLLVLTLILSVAARRVKCTWQDTPASRRQTWWFQKFFTPVFWLPLLQHRMQRALERNPIGWLHQHSTAARLTKWGWCLAVVLAESLLTTNAGWGQIVNLQTPIAFALLLGLALSAAGSFMRERQTGVMELLLVTPLPISQIIEGRLRGLWRQFLPSMSAVLIACGSGMMIELSEKAEHLLLVVAGGFATLPLIGLYFSLRQRHVLSAWILTAMAGLLVPAYAAMRFGGPSQPAFVWLALPLIQIALAASAGTALHRNLTHRRFAQLPV